MLYYDRLDLSEESNVAASNSNKEYMVCCYQFFNHGFKFKDCFCNGGHHLKIMCLNFSVTAIITVKTIDYYCVTHDISKPEAIHLLENQSVKSILKIESIAIILIIQSKQKKKKK